MFFLSQTRTCVIVIAFTVVGASSSLAEDFPTELWKENPELSGLQLRYAWANKERSLLHVGVLSRDSRTLYRWKSIVLRAESDPTSGSFCAGRVPTIDYDAEKNRLNVIDILPTVRYVRLTKTQYMIGILHGSLFYRFAGILLREEDLPKGVLEPAQRSSALRLEYIWEIDMPRQFADKPASWRCFVRDDQETKPKSTEQ